MYIYITCRSLSGNSYIDILGNEPRSILGNKRRSISGCYDEESHARQKCLVTFLLVAALQLDKYIHTYILIPTGLPRVLPLYRDTFRITD